MRRARRFLDALDEESRAIDRQNNVLDTLRARLRCFLQEDGTSTHPAEQAALESAEVILERRALRYARRRALTYDILAQMDSRHALLIQMRYMDGEKWAVIADELEVSLSWVYTLHNKALGEFGRLFYNQVWNRVQ